MMGEGEDRVAVVTGGSSGIGLSVCETLLSKGYKVAFFGKKTEHVADALEHLILRHGVANVMGRSLDVSLASQVETFFEEVTACWHAPDTLVCSAGISPKAALGPDDCIDLDLEQWQRVLAVNLTGVMLCCRQVSAPMIASGFGRIIMVGSIAGRTQPKIAGTAYCATKSALSGLMRSLMVQTAGHGITVNLVAPGRIVTPMTGPIDHPVNQAAIGRIPVGRLGQPGDIAHAIAFLASRKAGFINGAVIDVNGGEFSPP
ncbi:SDR family oxidoreductase (plasmid) [Peteryoungia desertarenae]|uniref:SDR family oxidoreductase n=1 Tax=Peteryoungia desertarenae TaxID=1813451 RepID=A0ABX6QTX3_9HYPH|nr:SDR family NAD(P)-dependent oxidoreductase [Peteryoungia desertarenae]QLF71731.1 SDR family oxidoreductase [Peteryoungia desertarenae]